MTIATQPPTAVANVPPTHETVVTTIPKPTGVSAVPPSTTELTRYSITEADVAAIESRRGLKVLDIRDKTQVEAIIQLHKDAKKGRTTVERERTEANAGLRKIVEDDIALNNKAAAELQMRMNPIEKEAESEIKRVEAALEAERVAAKTAMLNSRKTALLESVGEFTDILAAYPDEYLLSVADAGFNAMLVTVSVQVAGRKQLAEQQRVAKEAADKIAADKAESERLAENERLKQQAIEDQQRRADQAKLDAARAAFQKQQHEAAELQRKADEDRAARIAQEELDRQHRDAERVAEQNAKLAEERAELESQRMAIEDEKREAIAAQATARLMLDNTIYGERVNQLTACGWWGEQTIQHVPRDRLIAMTQVEFGELMDRTEHDERQRLAEIESEQQLLDAMKPDKERLREWVERIGELVTEDLPQMQTEGGQELLVELQAKLAESLDDLREMVE